MCVFGSFEDLLVVRLGSNLECEFHESLETTRCLRNIFRNRGARGPVFRPVWPGTVIENYGRINDCNNLNVILFIVVELFDRAWRLAAWCESFVDFRRL